ncbi:MAG: tetratricopeptide repeat protein, partial [Candidatus Binatia bacterium]
ELDLLVALGVPLVNVLGFAAPEVAANYRRALDVARKLGDRQDLFGILDGLHGYYVIRDEIRTGFELAEQMQRIAEQSGDPTLLLEASHVLGCSHFRLGNHAEGIAHLERAIALYDSPESGDTLAFSGHDSKVCCLAHLAIALWMTGRPERALARSREAVALGERLGHPSSLLPAEVYLAWLHEFRAEPEAAREIAERAAARAREHGLAYWVVVAGFFLGEGSERSGGSSADDPFGRMHRLFARAVAAWRARERSEGLDAVDSALALAAEHGEGYLEAEFLRLRGELLLLADDPAARPLALAAFLAAEATARRQGAAMFELRALTSRAERRAWGEEWREAIPKLAALCRGLPDLRGSRELAKASAILDAESTG